MGISARLEDLRFVGYCTACKRRTEFTYAAVTLRTQLKCECGHGVYSTGEVKVIGIPEWVVQSMKELVHTHVKRYKTDLDIDLRTLSKHAGPFLWGIRKTGTSLLLLDLHRPRKDDESYHLFHMDNERFFHYDGSYLHYIDAASAHRIWSEETIEWKI